MAGVYVERKRQYVALLLDHRILCADREPG